MKLTDVFRTKCFCYVPEIIAVKCSILQSSVTMWPPFLAHPACVLYYAGN